MSTSNAEYLRGEEPNIPFMGQTSGKPLSSRATRMIDKP